MLEIRETPTRFEVWANHNGGRCYGKYRSLARAKYVLNLVERSSRHKPKKRRREAG